MKDTGTTAARSANMRAIRSTGNTTTERRLAALLARHGIRGWKSGHSHLGRPDFVFPSESVAVFVDGCFWHSCPNCGHLPKSNRRYWRTKLARNVARDGETTRRLRSEGFLVVRLWECGLRTNAREAVQTIQRALRERLAVREVAALKKFTALMSRNAGKHKFEGLDE